MDSVLANTETNKSIRWPYALLADIFLIWGAFFFYRYNAWFKIFVRDEAPLLLFALACFYTVVRIMVNIRERDSADANPAPGFLFFAVLKRTARKVIFGDTQAIFRSKEEKTQFLFILVKLYFIPVMMQFAVNNYYDMYHEIRRVQHTGVNAGFMLLFNNTIFPLSISFFFLLDTWLFSFGYLFEAKWLGNRIRSVEPTLSGWLVAMLCYPPFNEVLNNFAPQYSFTYAYFESPQATFFLRISIFALFFIYTFASVSLGSKCSNLTNRGIVSRGAYAIVRHPAYVSKVTAWWLMLLPMVSQNYLALAGMAVWTIIYLLRAYTEERHLLADNDYAAYCQKVKYRFIPGLY